MRSFCKSKAFAVLLTMLGCSLVFFGWRHITKPKPWSDERDGEGSVYSLATGLKSEVGEIAVAGGYLRADAKGYSRVVCCYEVKTGRIRWEHRDPGYAELYGLQLHVGIDTSGDVILASHKPLISLTPEATVAKLDGSTGGLIWEKQLKLLPVRNSEGSFVIERPVIDAHGNVWQLESIASGDQIVPQIVVLDGRDGKVIFQHQLNGSLSESLVGIRHFMWPMQIECLEDGGAVVFAFDEHGLQHGLRFSSVGKLLCEFSMGFPDNKSVEPMDLRRFLDEKHRRITLVKECWGWGCTMRGGDHVHAAAFSLDDGKKQWESIHQLELEGSSDGHLPEFAVLRTDGDIELRHKKPIRKNKTNWLRWSLYKGIPQPEQTVIQRNLLARTVISGTDGSIRKTMLDSSLKDWFEVQTTEAKTSTCEIFISGYGHSIGRIRCLDARRWMPDHHAEGSTQKQHCFRLVRTPSGRTVMARDDTVYTVDDYHWQVMGCR